MKLTIYDYNDTATEIELPINTLDEISCIDVSVFSGDEVVNIYLKNGLGIHGDSSKSRRIDFNDGGYTLDSAELIQNWIKVGEQAAQSSKTVSYERLWKFV